VVLADGTALSGIFPNTIREKQKEKGGIFPRELKNPQ